MKGLIFIDFYFWRGWPALRAATDCSSKVCFHTVRLLPLEDLRVVRS